MVHCSNSSIGILNCLTFSLSIPIIAVLIWLLRQQDKTGCVHLFEQPILAFWVLMMVISLAGLIGACCRVSWLLWLYLLFISLIILILLCFTIFAIVVTNKSVGEVLPGMMEYSVGDQSPLLQHWANKNWPRIRSCLQHINICNSLINAGSITQEEFYREHISASQAGCCIPSRDCNFTYVSPTKWIGSSALSFTNADCKAWSNDPQTLCYNCRSCKAGVLSDDNMGERKKVAIHNCIMLAFLIVVLSVGCRGLRNNREDKMHWNPQP